MTTMEFFDGRVIVVNDNPIPKALLRRAEAVRIQQCGNLAYVEQLDPTHARITIRGRHGNVGCNEPTDYDFVAAFGAHRTMRGWRNAPYQK